MNPIMLYTMISAFSLIMCVYFFRRAAGGLHIGRLNLLSISFYLFAAQVFAGVVLIVLGFDQHYTMRVLISRDSTVTTTYYVVMAVSALWPACMLLFLKLFRIAPQKEYRVYLDKPVQNGDSRFAFWAVMACSAVCIGLLAVLLVKIGYIPLLMLVHHPADFSFALARIEINSIFVINMYVRNILVLLAVPALSYVAFAFALTTRKWKWMALAAVLIVASVITKTFNFEKTPVVFHMLVYVLILVYYKGGIKLKWILPLLGVGAAIVLAFYAIMTQGVQHDLYNGVGGRLLFSQVGALSYNFDAFPSEFPYLMGRSFAPTILKLIGIDPELHLRSARLIMEFYFPWNVYDGVAGVMNSFYIGEAYANYGWVGAAFSVVWTAFVLSGLYALTLKMRKTPVTLVFAAYFGVFAPLTTQGGFMDFVYNSSWLITAAGLLLLEYGGSIAATVKKRLARRG